MSRAAHAGLMLMLFVSSSAAEPSGHDKKRAAELATQSAKHYKRGEFEVSVALLRQAYALYPEPNLLYNLARSLESMGDKRGAIDQYNKYLATAKRIDDRGAIQRRVSLLERELGGKPTQPKPATPTQPADTAKSAEPANAAEPPSPPSPPVAMVEPSPPLEAPLADPFAPLPPEKLTGPSKLPLIPIGIGASAIGVGIGFGMRARDFEERADNEPIGTDAAAFHDSAVSNARVANILFVTGGAVVAAGIVWEVFVLRAQSKKSDAVVVRPMSGARGIALEWTLP